MADSLELPPDAVLVHVGPFKTGTTSIQATLAAARPALREHGVLYPGTAMAHHRAARSLRQERTGWQQDASEAPSPAVWSRLVQEVRQASGRVVISSEFLGDADAQQRQRLVRELGESRVHVVAAARGVGPLAVSMWQQVLKEGYPVSIEEWLERNLGREGDAGESGFWSRVDPERFTRGWVDLLGPERVTVLALAEGDRELLPRSFEQLLGLPDGVLQQRAPDRANRGLTAVEAGLLHELNAQVAGQLSWREYNRLVRDGLVHRVAQVRKPAAGESKPGLPAWAAERAAAATARGAEAVRASGVRVLGSLEALTSSREEVGVAPVPESLPVDLAVEAIIGSLAAGARGRWSLDDPRGPAPGSQLLSETGTRELVSVLARRVRASLRRRLRRLRRG